MGSTKESTCQIALYWLGSNSGRVKQRPETEYFCVFTQPRSIPLIDAVVRGRDWPAARSGV